MIQANELRIGNLVNILHPISKKWNFERIKAKTIANIEHNPNHDLIVNNIEPIPLTPEILEKCGFKFTDNGEDFNTWENKIEIWQHDEGFCHSYAFGGEVNYLHQLQNLFQCLCGEELKINI